MANLHITEFSEVSTAPDGKALFVCDMSRIVREQVVVYAASTPSVAFKQSTSFIRVYSDEKAFLNFGDSPSATDQNIPLAADSPEYFGVKPGDKVAAYDGSSQ